MQRKNPPYQKYLPILPREQWLSNDGYCGEVALISAGLYYGQYLSQFDVRRLATGKQAIEVDFTNAERAATRMLLKSQAWHAGGHKTARDFLAWIKGSILDGAPVAVGIYMNVSIFTDLEAGGTNDYDHEVPVIGIESNHPLSDRSYHDDDYLIFSDNGLYTPGDMQPYLFRYGFGCFLRTRDEANEPGAPPYSLAKDRPNSGLALTGIESDESTLRVQVLTNPNHEQPEIHDKSETRPKAEDLNLMVTVSGMSKGAAYKFYRYDSLAKVPTSEFNKNAAHAAMAWDISRENPVVFETLKSNKEIIYRAVDATAP